MMVIIVRFTEVIHDLLWRPPLLLPRTTTASLATIKASRPWISHDML